MTKISSSVHEVFVSPGRERILVLVGASLALLILIGGIMLISSMSSRPSTQTTWYENEAVIDMTFGDFLFSAPEKANATAGMLLCETLWKDHPTASFNWELMRPYTKQLVSLVYLLVASDTPLDANMNDVFSDLIANPENLNALQPSS